MRLTAHGAGRAEAEAEWATSARRAELALAEDLSRSLQDMAFAWTGAREAMMADLDSLLRQITAAILPPMAAASLAPLVAETLAPLVRTATARPLRLVLNPGDERAIRAHLPVPAFPMTVEADAAILSGTARILSGPSEILIDPSAAVAEILAALDDIFTLNAEVRHG